MDLAEDTNETMECDFLKERDVSINFTGSCHRTLIPPQTKDVVSLIVDIRRVGVEQTSGRSCEVRAPRYLFINR